MRGVVATDALIGTFARLHDPSLVQNRCFLYHLIGNGTGEWRVPVGGMGAVTDALARAAREAGAEIVTGAGVSGIESDGADGAEVTWHDGDGSRAPTLRLACSSNVAPWVLQILLGEPRTPATKPEGSQLKINLLLDRLPRLQVRRRPRESRSPAPCTSPRTTASSQQAYAEAAAGGCPTPHAGRALLPLADRPLDPRRRWPAQGMHTLTYFGRAHARRGLFDADVGAPARRGRASGRSPRIDECLDEPIESLLATRRATAGRASRPRPRRTSSEDARDARRAHLPRRPGLALGPNRARLDSPAQRWGVATDLPNVLLCGSGARRGRCGQRPRRSQRGPGRAGLAARPLTASTLQQHPPGLERAPVRPARGRP